MAQGSSASTLHTALPPASAEAFTGVPIGVLVVSRGRNGRTEKQPLVLTYGLDRCETSSDGVVLATYTCRPRRLETIMTTSGPRVRRLICQVWVTMHVSYGASQSASTSPPPIVWEGRVGDPCIGRLTQEEWVDDDVMRCEKHEVHCLLPKDQPIEVLESIDYETLLGGLRVAHRQDFEEELGGFGGHLVPRRPLQRLLFPDLSEKAYCFYLCHGSGAAVHVADLCKLLWWVGPWVATGRVTDKLELLYTHLDAHHIPRLLITHNPSPLLYSDHTLSHGACFVTASPITPGALMLHIRESSRCVKTTAVTPWFLWQSPSPGCTGCHGEKLKVVFVVGEDAAKHGVPPEYVGTCSATKEDLVRLLRDGRGLKAAEGRDGEEGPPRDGSGEVEMDVAMTLGEAVGGQWPLRPLALLDEVICSSELRCKPHRHPYSARCTATEAAAPPWRAVDEGRPTEMLADVSSAYLPLERGIRPYLQEGYEDDFDEEIEGGVLPNYLLCRRFPDDSPHTIHSIHHENRRHARHSTASKKTWRLYLGRPCARAGLGAPVILPVMVKFQHSAVPPDFDYTSLRVRTHGDHYFQDVEATWISSMIAPSTHGGAVNLLPLLAIEARVQHTLITEVDGMERRQRYDELWRRLPERVALSLVAKGDEGADVVLDEARFELNPLDFTGDLVRGALCASPDTIIDTLPSEPERWTMVLVTSDAVGPLKDHDCSTASEDGRANDSCGVPHACSAPCGGGGRGAAAFMDSVRAAFPSEGGRGGREPEYFPDIGLTVVYAQGDQKSVDEVRGGEEGEPVVVVAVIIEDDCFETETYRKQLTTAQRYGVEPLTVAVGSQGFVRHLEHGLSKPPGSVLVLQHTGLSARNCGASGEWRTWVNQDRNVLAILHACRLAATLCSCDSDHHAAPDIEAPLQPETGPDEQEAPLPTSNKGWTGLTLKQVLRCLKEHPPARGVHQWPKPPTYERLRSVKVELEARMHELTAIPSNEDWVLSFGAIVDDLRNELRPLGPGIHDGYDHRGQQALTSLCADLHGAGVNLHHIVEAFDKAAVNENTPSTSSSSDDGGECTVDLTAAYERFKADQQRAINLHAFGDYRQAFHTCVEAWVAGMMTLTAVIEDQPEAIQARWCIGQDVLVVMATAAASALEGGLPRVGWRMVWAGLDLALRPNCTLPSARTGALKKEGGGAEHTSASGGGEGGCCGVSGGGGGGGDRKACYGDQRADEGAEHDSPPTAEDSHLDHVDTDLDTNSRSLSIHLGPSNPYVLPLIMVMAQILPALCHNTHPHLSSDVALTTLRAVLFAAERVSRPYDPLLAYMLEAVGAARLRVAHDGGGRAWQLKEAAARLQAALHIREQHELRLARHQRQQQSSSLPSATLTASAAFSRTSSSSSSSSGSSGSPPPPSSSPPPPPPPPPSPQEQLLTLPPLLAVSIATAYVHLADYSLLYARLLLQQRYRRAPLLRKQYAQAYLYTARRKLPKELSSQHCVVRGIASGFYAIDCWEKGEGGGGCVCGGQNMLDDKPEWWSALDGGRSSCGLDHAEHTLVKRLLLWPGRYRGLTLVRLIKRGGEALVLEGRYNGQRCVAKLPFQRGSVDREMVIRRRLRDLEAGSDQFRGGGGGGGDIDIDVDDYGGRVGVEGAGSRPRASAFLARVLKEFTEPWPCLVLRYESMDLLTILRTDTSRPISWVINVLYQLSRALCSLHDHGVAHGDVAPRNVLIRDDGTVCMIDLGMAKVLDGTLEGQVARGDDVVGIGRTMRRMLNACDNAASELRGLWEACCVEDRTQRPDLADVRDALREAMSGPLGRCSEPCIFALPKTDEDEARTRKIN